MSEGLVNEYEGGAVPEPITMLFVARWLQGAASVEWLLEHPEWYEWADICATAHEQAMAEKMKPEG